MRAVSNVLVVARRELGSYFSSPLAYVVTFFFLVISGLLFYQSLSSQQATIRPTVSTIMTILLLLAPLLSMRLLAEEQRTGTLELLLTAPVRDWEVVVGKFLAAVGLLGVMLLLTLIYPAILFIWGQPDPGEVFGGYLAVLLFGAAALSIGLFASSLTQNQIVSAVIAFAVMLVLWVLDTVVQPLGGPVGSVLTYVAVYPHISDMSQGVVSTKDVLYYVSLITGALFLTTRSLEARRWRG
jgi:ABC-2 type transport system permease protein